MSENRTIDPRALVCAYADLRMDEGDDRQGVLLSLQSIGLDRPILAAMGVPGIPGPAAVDWTPEKSGEAISILLSLYRDAALQSLGPEEAGRKLAKLRAGIPAGEGSFAQAPAQQPEPIRRDRKINISAADLAGKPQKDGPVLLEDFTLEECPMCERESVIRAKGISKCRFCGCPMIPCTACSSCSNPCPYGLSHGNFFLLKPDAKSVSAREAREWMALKRQQTDSLKRGRPRT